MLSHAMLGTLTSLLYFSATSQLQRADFCGSDRSKYTDSKDCRDTCSYLAVQTHVDSGIVQ